MAQASSSEPTRMVFLLHGEDSFRMRLRLGELVRALLQRAPIASGDLARAHEVRLGELVGVSLHDARTDPASAIALSGQAQGLFDAPDERRVVVVEHAEALRDYAVIAGFPREAGLVLVSVERLASAVGSDTERIEQEVKKLGAYAAGATVTAADVRALVSGAIEADVFELTQAVVRQDARVAIGTLERLLADGNAPQQILALLLWQFRVLLFATAMKTNADGERMAKAIRSTPGAIARATAFARRVSRADIVRAYEAIYATDQVIKTGRADSDLAALTLCVLDLCHVANADLRDMLLVEPPKR